MSLSEKLYNGDWASAKDIREAVKELKRNFCTCKDISKERESAYKRIQEEFNKNCKHHIINEIFGEDLI